MMSSKNLVSVSIPKNLLLEVDRVVKKSGKYVSRADFCRAAVRQLIVKEFIIISEETIGTIKEAIT